MSRPSSPVLKARRQSVASARFYSNIIYGLATVAATLWLIRYVLLDEPPFANHPLGSPELLENLEDRNISNGDHSPDDFIHHHRVPLNKTLYEPVSHDAQTLSVPHNLFSPPATLSAILPVTETSLQDLDQTLRHLLADPGLLTEVVLLVPQFAHTLARGVIRELLGSEEKVQVEFSLRTSGNALDPDIALIDAARHVSADAVLFLEPTGLRNVTTAMKAALLLKSPPASPFPTGPSGFSLRGGTLGCWPTSSLASLDAYLVPPFVMHACLVPDTIKLPLGRDAWAALSREISRKGLGPENGVLLDNNGIALSPCADFSPEYESQTALDTTNNGSPTGIFVAVVHLPDVPQLLPFACGILAQGYELTVYAIQPSGVDAEDMVVVGDCSLRYSAVSLSNAELLNELPGYPPRPDILVLILEDELSSSLGSNATDAGQVQVRISPGDLPLADWMGTLTLDEWRNWHVPTVELSVITNDRPASLTRLLNSITNAHYFGDSPSLRINVEQTADDDTKRIVSGYDWPHGPVFVHHRIVHGGLLTAVVESWYPRSNHSYGIILEDDVELSPLFYAWAKLALLRYRYGSAQNLSPRLFGISLYQQKNLELRPDGRATFDARAAFAAASLPYPSTPYLSQIPCSWGAVYFPEHWAEFHAYLAARLGDAPARVVVPDVRSNRWTRSWKRFFIELVYLRGYLMLYPNFAGHASLSTNHLERGSHVRDVRTDAYARKKALFHVPLLQPAAADASSGLPSTGLLDLPEGRLPEWGALPVLDLLGLFADEDELARRGRERRTELTGCDGEARPHDVRDLLCVQ